MRKKTSHKTAREKINHQKKNAAMKEQKVFSDQGLFAEIEQRDEKFIAERLQFEMLLADISNRFINLPADHIDSEIVGAQRAVCDFLGLNLCALWQWVGEASGFFTMTHIYRPLGGPPIPERMDAKGYFPWCLKQTMANKIVVLSSIDKAPAEAARDKETWRHYGIKTAVVIPLSVGKERPIGGVSFNTILGEHRWPEEIVKRLQLVAQIFTNALNRKLSEDRLREGEERLALAADSAGAGLWSLNFSTGCYWLTDKARELFGFAENEVVTLDRVLDVVHPDDRELLRQKIQEVLRIKKEDTIEYRIIRADGSMRWIVSRGRVQSTIEGEADCLMGISMDITDRKLMETLLREQLKQIEELKYKIERENVYLRDEANLQCLHEEIVGESDVLKRILSQAKKVAPTDSTVLITGETGTGKELIARAIHCHSRQSNHILVKVDCASLPAALIESELFGREKGAYTGALAKQIGRFEIADGSTIFLDEIGELPLELQSKLLRVLENGEFERLGSPKTIRVNVRVIAATNRNLEDATKKGTFREDLYYRLNVFPIKVPPLREHRDDIPLLVYSFINEFAGKMGKKIRMVPESTLEMLKQYHWPGNVRELRNIIEQAIIITEGDVLQVNIPQRLSGDSTESGTLEQAERRHITGILGKTGWRIKGQNGAAELLGLKPSTLYAKMEKLGIPTSRGKGDIST